MSMKISSSTSGTLSQEKLREIYWKTFVGYAKKDDTDIPISPPSIAQMSRIERRQGSFEYMVLTARGGSSSSTSDTAESRVSSTTSSVESLKDDASPMYADLEIGNVKRELSLNRDITIIDEATTDDSFDTEGTHSVPSSPHVNIISPRCSPILVQASKNHRIHTSQQLDDNRQLNEAEATENYKLSVDDESEESSFDRLESTSPSMEPAPWKDHNLSIQLWMVPTFLSENNDKLVSMPPFPEFDHSHYVPTLEAIMEESEESCECRNLSRSRLTKSASFSDDTDLNSFVDELSQRRSSSLGDVISTSPQSQDDLFSITSTFGSFNSMRRITTFENLSTEERDCDDNVIVDSDGSSDELDRAACYDSTTDSKRNSKCDSEDGDARTKSPDSDASKTNDYANCESKSRGSSCSNNDVGHEEVSESEAPVNEAVSDKPASDSSRDVFPESIATSSISADFLSSGRSSPMIESAPELYDFHSCFSPKYRGIRRDSGFTTSDADTAYCYSEVSKPSTVQRDSGVTISDIDVPGLPKELYFDSKDIPQIVVMFAQQELERDMKAIEEEDSSTASPNAEIYCRKSDRENDFDSPRGGTVQRRISQLKSADSSRLSNLSSSTPELSAVNDDCLLYIPVSYASEAAAKKKRKRNVTLTNAEAMRRRTNLTKALHTRSLISGTGLGNGFSSLRKRLRSRKSTSGTLRRSQSEKPQLSYSSPDVSSPMTRFLNSPRRRAKLKSTSTPGNEEPRNKGIKKRFSNVLRRLSSKFSSQRRPVVVKRDYSRVTEQSSPAKSYTDELAGDTSETLSSQSIDSPLRFPYECEDSVNDLLIGRGVDPRYYRDYRNRSHSVPLRPRSQSSSLKNGSTESDVFDSLQSEDSLDKVIYV